MSDDIAESLLPPGTTAWILASGKAGHEVNCLGVAKALGVAPIIRRVAPRRLFAALAPYGPIDPRDAPRRGREPLAPPFPDITLAAGRITVPYLRTLKRASPRTFTVFLQDPRTGRRTADVIWVPEHDRLRGDNVVTTLTSPHPLRPDMLMHARNEPDPRIARLASPRVAMILGGPSAGHKFDAQDVTALVAIAAECARGGKGLMITPSRRTPSELVAELAKALAAAGPDRAFVWHGTGANPYIAMLANAEAIIVTGDSANMIGEAVATGAPVHVYEPSGDSPKMKKFIDGLVAQGAVRRWRGTLENWTYEPIDATATIAREIAMRYVRFKYSA
ncbi:MAG TPA: mitochondrial fission ELM1 family protein [Beijerinckiaceae bacterium]|nr:mitochondrial fission ELM1 family protein [Beijerinckiaceae bacterium]